MLMSVLNVRSMFMCAHACPSRRPTPSTRNRLLATVHSPPVPRPASCAFLPSRSALVTCATLLFSMMGCLTRIRKRADSNFQKLIGVGPDLFGTTQAQEATWHGREGRSELVFLLPSGPISGVCELTKFLRGRRPRREDRARRRYPRNFLTRIPFVCQNKPRHSRAFDRRMPDAVSQAVA